LPFWFLTSDFWLLASALPLVTCHSSPVTVLCFQ
jgi:hypothetical protein